MSCPVCRKVLTIPYEGLDGLPHNFFIQNLIDAREASNKQSSDVLCEACEKDVEVIKGNIPPATIYCVDCNQRLCTSCSRARRGMRDPHQVKELGSEMTLQTTQQLGSSCDQHTGKQLELYCFDCKVNVCKKCFAVKHNRHKCGEVAKVAKDIAKSFKSDVKRISSRISQFQSSAIRTDEEERKLTRFAQDVETLVKQKGEVLKRTVDKQVEHLLGEVQTFKKKGQKEVASRKDRLEFGIMTMESFTVYARELMCKGSLCDITRAADDMHVRANELLQTYVTPVDYCAPGIKFVPMNTDEFTNQNLIGIVLTSKDAGKFLWTDGLAHTLSCMFSVVLR